MSESASESARRLWVVHSVVRWDSLLSNTLVLWVVELLSGFFFFCGIPRVLEAVSGDCVCVCLCGCCFLGGGGAGEGRKGAARGGGREIERDRERRIIILKEEKEKGGGSSGDRDRESVSSGLIAGKGGRWR